MRLEGKVAIVTGGALGMGAAEAKLFAKEGAKVVVADLSEEHGRACVGEIEKAGGTALFHKIDVTVEAEWEELIAATLEAFGRLDILVNNAGLSGMVTEDMGCLDWWHRIMEVNATSVFLGSKHAVSAMTANGGGSIVNISSIGAFLGAGASHHAYQASKGAVYSITKATAVRHGPDGIRCNSVHPGYLPPMKSARPQSDPAPLQKVIGMTPLRRIGRVEEVANAVLFLASDEASFITGTELIVDGGFMAQ
jgi:NAD(P)-dependent dehydrogenase (short-subunit alcohol dehydrogenase family)